MTMMMMLMMMLLRMMTTAKASPHTMTHVWMHVLVIQQWVALFHTVKGEHMRKIYDVDYPSYTVLGDINLGSFQAAYRSSTNGLTMCSSTLYRPNAAVQFMEAIAYAVRIVNDDVRLLPNVSLGFVTLETCNNPKAALAQALSFMPIAKKCSNDGCNSSSVSEDHDSEGEQTLKHYDVVGMLGPTSSDEAVPVALLMSAAKLPVLGYRTSSDELSDKIRYPYFLRVVPSGYHEVLAMMNFIKEQDWSYISVLYSTGYYGETAFNNIKALSDEMGICMATSHEVMRGSDMHEVVADLLNFPRARVVILYMLPTEAVNLCEAVRDLNATGLFVWLGSSAFFNNLQTFTGYTEEVAGAFVFTTYSTQVPSFVDYFRRLFPGATSNPWFNLTWEDAMGCSLENGTCDLTLNTSMSRDFTIDEFHSNAMDAVFTFAHSLDALLRDKCPEVTGAAARDCVKGDELLFYLRKTVFKGYTGMIEFDNNGDMMGRIQIKQLVTTSTSDESQDLEKKLVAMYEIKSQTTWYQGIPLSWHYFRSQQRIVPLKLGEDVERPEAVCSRPCDLHEYKVRKTLSCCWECRFCRVNERLLPDRSKCEACPPLTWPDPTTDLTTCKPIVPSYPQPTDTMTALQFSLSTIALIVTIAILLLNIKFRHARAIKAASRELSFLQLVAIMLGYITVMFLQATPTDDRCVALYCMFCLSFSWLYSPLLVKAIRIYRIFRRGPSFNQRPKFISPKSQLLFAALLILFQVVLCVIVTVIYKPRTILTQPQPTEAHVELSCDLTVPGLASFLAYNIVLVLLSSIFAFKTRKVPDNFKESRFIFMCVFTTLLIWLVYIPTYVTATKAVVRVLLVSLALLLNHTVALVFLFIPNLYVAIFLPEMDILGRVRAEYSRPRKYHTQQESVHTIRVSPFIPNGNFTVA